MKRARSLEAILLVRLALVFAAAFVGVAAWLWFHLGQFEIEHPQPIVHQVLAEFFYDIAWTVPVVLMVILAFTAFTLRRSLAILRDISARASSISPGYLNHRLPEEHLPVEIAPLVRATNDMLDRLEAGFDAQRRFTANAAHELRTPLQLLAAELERLNSDAASDVLRAHVARMIRLVGQLLAVARLDATKNIAEGNCDLGQVTADTLVVLAPLALKVDVSLALDRPETPVLVQGQADMVGDLVRNLAENALAVAPKGTEVNVSVSGTGCLSIIDCGAGIAVEHRPRLFERFWRAPGAPPGGSGLGLAIVKEIADACAAQIEIDHPPEGGTRFRVRFLSARSGPT